MYKFGVIDPAKVVRTALQDAASVAGLLDHHRGDDRRQAGAEGPGRRRRRHGRHGRHGRHDVIRADRLSQRNGGLAAPVFS